MPGIFISYRRDDSAYIAAAINERFQQRFGDENVFFDIDTIPLGVDFRDHIGGAVGKCDVLLVVIGDQWINAKDNAGELRLPQSMDYVRVEIESALQRSVPVVPVLVGNAVMPTEAQLPESIRALAFRNAAEVRAGRDLSDHLDRLVRDVGQVAGIHPNKTQAQSVTEVTSPAASISDSNARKHHGPMLAAILLLLVVAGVGIAFAMDMFSQGDDELNGTDSTKDTGASKDDRPSSPKVKDEIAATKDQKLVHSRPAKDAVDATKDGAKIDKKDGSLTATKDVTKDATKDTGVKVPAGVDRSDAKATAIAILAAYKSKDFATLVTFQSENNRKLFEELAEQKQNHPRYESILHGWRGDAVSSWTGKVEAPRYEKRASESGRIKAIVRFEQKSLNPVVVVAMFLNDSQWEFEDIESPPEVFYKRMSTERPK